MQYYILTHNHKYKKLEKNSEYHNGKIYTFWSITTKSPTGFRFQTILIYVDEEIMFVHKYYEKNIYKKIKTGCFSYKMELVTDYM
jgi:hypothetical protein